MKLAAIVITFFPNIDELTRNIFSYIQDVDFLVIWENSPELNLREKLQLGHLNQKVTFLKDGGNVGIATALNSSIKWLNNGDYTHIMTLDQDSNFKLGVLAEYKKLVEHSPVDKVGVYGINPNNWGVLLYNSELSYLNVTDTITSGSISPVMVFKDCGYFEDDLFIDAVDYEFCYRIKAFGYQTIVFPKIVLEHQVGHSKKTWLGFTTDNYSAFRTYFIIRNHIIMWKRYPDLFSKTYKVTLIKTHILVRIVKIILAENKKYNKIKAIVTGFIHGLQGKLGYYKA